MNRSLASPSCKNKTRHAVICRGPRHATKEFAHKTPLNDVKNINAYSAIRVGTGETVAVGIVVDGRSRGIETQDAQHQTEHSDRGIEHGQGDLAGAGKPLAVVEVEPVDATEAVTEPTSKESALNHVISGRYERIDGLVQTYNKRVEVAEDRDGLGDNPGNQPAGQAQGDPDGDRAAAAAVDETRLGASAEVDILQADVTIHDTGTDNLQTR